MNRKRSIHDIAKELGISATTISFIINGRAQEKRISTELAEKVKKYLADTGYQPNMIARSLRTGKSKIIGMLVEDISDPFFSSISRGVEKIASQHGYKIFFSSTENDSEIAKSLLKVFRDRQVDGYILAPAPGTENEIRELVLENQPVVIFDRHFPELETHLIEVDNFGGAHKGVMHLLQNGYSRVGFVTLDSLQTQMADRLRGYETAMTENRHITAVCRVPYVMDEPGKVALIKTFIEENASLNALLFATNYLAISGLKAISQLGLNIPNDLAIVGFDDNTHFALFKPSITALAQPVDQISEQVVSLLMALMGDPSLNKVKKTILLDTELVVRESSRKAI